jgi:FMN phosphatase YigB (HAD superfamily)
MGDDPENVIAARRVGCRSASIGPPGEFDSIEDESRPALVAADSRVFAEPLLHA